jgi:hypothetical protein
MRAIISKLFKQNKTKPKGFSMYRKYPPKIKGQIDTFQVDKV